MRPLTTSVFHRLRIPNQASVAFTRADLLVTLAVIALIALLGLRSVAAPRSISEIQICFSNHRQLTRAWTLFAEDNSGQLPGNLDGGDAQNMANTNRSWVVGWLDFSGRSDNTNTALLKNAQLGRYLDSASVFRCPSDPSRSRGLRGQLRVRSVSMNGYLGERSGTFTAGYKQFKTIQSIVDPKPAECFLFIEEREDSINDPWFPIDMASYDPLRPAGHQIVDYPADWHDGSAVLSFVDGHVENWRWIDPRTRPPHRPGAPLALAQPSPNNPDVARLQRSTSRKLVRTATP